MPLSEDLKKARKKGYITPDTNQEDYLNQIDKMKRDETDIKRKVRKKKDSSGFLDGAAQGLMDKFKGDD